MSDRERAAGAKKRMQAHHKGAVTENTENSTGSEEDYEL